MKSGKGSKTIEKVVRLRKHEEKEKSLRVAGKMGEVEEKEEKVKTAKHELEKLSGKIGVEAGQLREGLKKSMRVAEMTAGLDYVRSLEDKRIHASKRIRESEKELEKAAAELDMEREKLKEKSAEKRSAEKYLAGLKKSAAREQEKKEGE